MFEGQEVADQWYNEVERYDFSRHEGPRTGKHPLTLTFSLLATIFLAVRRKSFSFPSETI